MGLRGYLILLELPTFALHCVVSFPTFFFVHWLNSKKVREIEKEKKKKRIQWFQRTQKKN